MKKYRIYYNRVEEFYIDLEAHDLKEALEEFERDDLLAEEETGHCEIEIANVYTKEQLKKEHNIDM